MKVVKFLTSLALATSVYAQGQFGQSENSALILDSLKAVDQSTKSSAAAARAYQPGSESATTRLTNQNVFLLGQWQNVTYQAQSSLGFYSDSGAQAIIDYINFILYPDTKAADLIYTNKRAIFVQGGFIDYINPGLLKLRSAVDAASAAVQAKTRASQLTAMTQAFTQIEQNYADTQEIQQFGSLA